MQGILGRLLPFFALFLASIAVGNGTQVCLLGTAGGPGARADRAGIATLIILDDHRYLIDSGSGVARQLGGLWPSRK